MPELELDWSTAQVRDGKLTVSLSEKPTREWGGSFEAVEKLLNQGHWEKVKLKKDEVHVKGIEPGTEEKLRHFLESIVLQANADLEPDEDSEDDSDSDEHDDDDESDDATEDRADADEDMTERFRAFG